MTCSQLGLVSLMLVVLCGCGGQQHGSNLACKEEEGRERCVTTGGPGEAIVTGAAAGAMWATAGGCKIAGCPVPLECNPETELCQAIRCGETLRRCPDGLECNTKTRTCR